MSSDLETRFTPHKGRGVFACRTISANKIIEVCPVILIPTSQSNLVDDTVLINYYWAWDDNYIILAGGYGSIYNHSFDPNVEAIRDYEGQNLIFRSVRDISLGEEITVNYSGLGNTDPVWYDVADQRQILMPIWCKFNQLT